MAEIIDMSNRQPYIGGEGPPSDGGDGGEMDARVSRVENDVREIKGDLTAIQVDLAVLKERVSHLPTKSFVFGVYTAVSAFIIAVTLFQSQIQQFFGIGG